MVGALLVLSIPLAVSNHTPAWSQAQAVPVLSASDEQLDLQYVGGLGGQIAGVAVSGTVAYIGEGSSLTVLDISDASHLTRVARLPLADLVSDLVVVNGRLYIAANSSGLLIYDIRDPLQPLLVGAFSTPAAATRVKVQGNSAYVVAGNLLIVDIYDPAHPDLRGSYQAPNPPINDVALAGNRAYVAYGYEWSSYGGVSILDVGDTAVPSQLGAFLLTDGAPIGVQVAGDLAYIITKGDQLYPGQGSKLRIVDVYDPVNPTARGLLQISESGRLLVANDVVYIAASRVGLAVVDVHNPDAPAPLGASAILGGSGGLQLVGDRLFVSTAGIDYTTPGFQIVDVSNPAAPAEIGGYRSLPLIRGVGVAQGYAYVAEYLRGFQIADLHEPTQPLPRGGYQLGGAPSQVQIVGDLAYITGGNTGFHIMGISDPDHPVRLGGLAPNGSTRDMRVVGNLAYISGINRLLIVDVSDPISPTVRGFYDHYTGDDSGVDVVGDLVYFAMGNHGLAILDVSDPAHPVERTVYTNLERASDVEVVGDRAYVATGPGGLLILDVSDPDNPVPLGSAHTTTRAYYVHVVDNLVYLTDYYDGVQILDVSNPAEPVLLAQYDHPGPVTIVGNMMYVAAGGAGLHLVRLRPDQPPDQGIITPAGGEVNTADGSASLVFPAGAVSGPTTVSISSTLDLPMQPGEGQIAVRTVAINARTADGQPLVRFDQPYTLTLTYSDTQLAALDLDEASLSAIYLDGQSWAKPPICVGCGVDMAANRFTLSLNRVTTIALVGKPAAPTTVAPTITSAPPDTSLTVGVPYRHTFTATGSPTPIFRVTVGALPSGLALDSASGVLAGTPTAPGTATFIVAASNGVAPDSTQSATLTVRTALYLPLVAGGP
jgi:hypothetical protein